MFAQRSKLALPLALYVLLVLVGCGSGEETTVQPGPSPFLVGLQERIEALGHEEEEARKIQTTEEVAAEEVEEELTIPASEEMQTEAQIQAKMNLESERIDDLAQAHMAEMEADAARQKEEEARSQLSAAEADAEDP